MADVGKFAIMAIDPGVTNGISQMIVYTRSSKKVKHPIQRFRAFEERVPQDAPKGPIGLAYEDMNHHHRNGFNPKTPYWPFQVTVNRLVREWIRFRHHAVSPRGFGVHPACTFLAMEDFVFGEIKDTRRDAFAAIYIAHRIEAQLHAMADCYTEFGFGPAHVGSVTWVQPSEKAIVEQRAERVDAAGLLSRDYSKSKRGRIMTHANDATFIALKILEKDLGVQGVLLPFDGERREPFVAQSLAIGDGAPFHPTDAFVPDPADPVRNRPKTRRSLRKAGVEVPRTA